MEPVEAYKGLDHPLKIIGFQPIDLMGAIVLAVVTLYGASFVTEWAWLVTLGIVGGFLRFAWLLRDRPDHYFASLLRFIKVSRVVVIKRTDGPLYRAQIAPSKGKD